MIYGRVDPETIAEVTAAASTTTSSINTTANTTSTTTGGGSEKESNVQRVIGADGTIKIIQGETSSQSSKNAFRKGMLPLRDMKKSWTLSEFMDMDSQFTFKVAAQTDKWIGSGGVCFDNESANNFQQYLRLFAFQRSRIGYLYGSFVNEEDESDKNTSKSPFPSFQQETNKTPPKNQKVIIEAIYEPPQQPDPSSTEGYILLDDPNQDVIDTLAFHLKLQKVGIIIGHPPRPDAKCPLTAADIISAAEFQLEAAGGVEATPFVTCMITMKEEHVSLEAYQVSRQCMEMVAEGALEICEDDPYVCTVNETFTAIQEGKEAKTIENNFFVMTAPIVQHTSELFTVCSFPRANRDFDANNGVPNHDELKKQLSKCSSGGNNTGWTFVDLLADFHLLMYLMSFLDVTTDIPKICSSIVDRENVPLDEGYKLIIASMAGLDGAYD